MSPPKQTSRKPRSTPPPKNIVAAQAADTELDVPTRVALTIFLVLALGFFLPAFMPGRGIFGTDYLAGSYQFMEFLSNQLRSGVIPKWVPYVYGGVPLHANPGSTYYPTRLVLMWLLPDSRIFPALLLLQFFIGGSGMYLLARELGARTWIAFVAGLCFMFTGITMSGLYSGHDGRIIVATFFSSCFLLHPQGDADGILPVVRGLATALGFSLLSFQIQSNYYMLLGGAFWTLFCAFQFRQSGWPTMAARTGLAVLAVAFAFALAAVNFLPFIDYIAESPRGAVGGRGYEYATSFSMPPNELAGLAVPEQHGVLATYHGKSFFKQHTEYVGAFVLAMLLLGFLFARRVGYWAFFALTAIVAITMSLGGFTPIYRLYYSLLPGVNKFRAPSISFFMVSMSLVAMAAITMEMIARIREKAPEAERAARKAAKGSAKVRTDADYARFATVGLMVLAVLLLFMSQTISSPAGEAAGWIRFALFLGVFAFLLWRWIAGKLSSRILAVALSVVTLTDLWVVTRKFFQTVQPPEEVYAADDIVDFLRSQNDSSRVWVFPYGGSQSVYQGFVRIGENTIPLRNYLMHFGIEQAGGEHGNQLDRWNKFAGAGQQTYVDWHNLLGAPSFMSAANIRYIISGVQLQLAGPDSSRLTKDIEEAYRGKSAIVYRNNTALPRAYVVPQVRVIPNTDSALAFMKLPGWNPRNVAVIDRAPAIPMTDGPLSHTAAISERRPDKVVVRTNTDRPGLLVLADVYAHGWKAWVDDKPTPIVITNVAFRGVPVGAGEHTVRFEFDPDDLRTGRIISSILFTILVAYWIWYGVMQFRRSRTVEPAA